MGTFLIQFTKPVCKVHSYRNHNFIGYVSALVNKYFELWDRHNCTFHNFYLFILFLKYLSFWKKTIQIAKENKWRFSQRKRVEEIKNYFTPIVATSFNKDLH